MSQAIQTLKFVLDRQLASSQRFTDEEFSPKTSIILGPAYSKYKLRRASDLYKNISIIPEELKPEDIEEGALKDGHFLSSVAALAEEPSLIQRLFLTEESNKVGLYAVWLNDTGTWKPVIIDEYIPCKHQSGSYDPVFARTLNDDLWVSFLEKAYAKIYGSYVNIEGISCQNVLRDLTGAPVEELNEEQDLERIWSFIAEAVHKEYFVLCSNQSAPNQAESEHATNSYAYTVLDAREIRHQGRAERLILVRNIWKNFEWKGEWSNRSPVWTEELRQELNYTEDDAREGLFWIKLSDYEAYFPSTWVCKYKPENKYFSVDLHHEARNYDVLRIRVHKEQDITISLNQKDIRYFQGTNYEGQYNYSYARLLLGKVFPDGLGYIDGNASEKHRNMTITQRLKPGTYVVAAEMHWDQNFFRDFNISFYSEYDIDIEAIPEADLLTIQKSLVLSSIEKVEESRKLKNYAKYGDTQIDKTEGSIHGLLYFYYVNNSTKSSRLTEKISFSNLENLQLCYPFKNPHQVEVTVVPDQEVLVLYKATKEDHAWAFSTSFSMRPLQAHEKNQTVQQEVYDYVDDLQRRAPVDVNEDYNAYIKEGHDLDFEGERYSIKRDSVVEERKTAETAKKSSLHPDYSNARSSRRYEHEEDRPVKKYPALNMEPGQTNSKKIPYINYDEVPKEIEVISSDPRIVSVKDERFKMGAGESVDIRLRFVAPKNPGTYHVQVDVRNLKSGLEESLEFVINNHESAF